uniref:Prolactin n=1 Tax=Callorhinchus milii TaxID=7868 RepID=A0A4W3K342_CALMI
MFDVQSSRQISAPGLFLMIVLVPGIWTTESEAISEPLGHKQSQQISLSDHCDRLIGLSIRVHALSNDIFNDFSEYYKHGQGHAMGWKAGSRCPNSSVATPNSKEQAQKLSVGEVLVTALVGYWHEPVRYLVAQFGNSSVGSGHFLRRSVEMDEQMRRLAQGMPKVAERVGLADLAAQQRQRWTEESPGDECSRTLQVHSLLSCFRRDSHKIVSFLKLLRCRLPHAVSC